MKQLLKKYTLPFLLFTTLGIMSAMVLRNHSSLQYASVEVYIYVMIWSVLIPNIVGFAVIISSDWIAAHYPVYFLEKHRLWVHYSLVAVLLLLTNYATIVLTRILGKVPNPFSMTPETRSLIIFIWFAEMIIIGLLLFSKSITYSVKILKEKQRLEAETIEAKYNALQQQLNPHFLFNSLNVLIAEIKYDPDTAVSFTQHLSEIYRYVLKSQNMKVVTIADELDFIESYIFLHTVRLGNCIHFDVQLTDEERNLAIPPLTLQLLVENVIKHNNISEKSPVRISLSFDTGRDMFVFSNNISPKLGTSSSGYGLKNLSARYKILNDKDIEITNENKTFEVALPRINEEKIL